MSTNSILLLISLNLILSTLNCFYAGRVWSDVTLYGTRIEKLLLWGSILQAGIGISIPIYLALSTTSTFLMIEDLLLDSEDFVNSAWAITHFYYIFLIALPLLSFATLIWLKSNTSYYISYEVSDLRGVRDAFKSLRNLYKNFFNYKDKIYNKIVLFFVVAGLSLTFCGFIIAYSLTQVSYNDTQYKVKELFS